MYYTVLVFFSELSDGDNYYKSIYEARFGKHSKQTSPAANGRQETPYVQPATHLHPGATQGTHGPSNNANDIARRLNFAGSSKTLSNVGQNQSSFEHQNLFSLGIKSADGINRSNSKSIPASPDNSTYSDSPPVETQDFRILSQFRAEENLDDTYDMSSNTSAVHSTGRGDNYSGMSDESDPVLDLLKVRIKKTKKANHSCLPTASVDELPKSDPCGGINSTSNFKLPVNTSARFNTDDLKTSSTCKSTSKTSTNVNVSKEIERSSNSDIRQTTAFDFSPYLNSEDGSPKFDLDAFSFSPVFVDSNDEPFSKSSQNSSYSSQKSKSAYQKNKENGTMFEKSRSKQSSNEKVSDIEGTCSKLSLSEESPYFDANVRESTPNRNKLAGFLDNNLPELQRQNAEKEQAVAVSKALDESPFVEKQPPVFPIFSRKNTSNNKYVSMIAFLYKYLVRLKENNLNTFP